VVITKIPTNNINLFIDGLAYSVQKFGGIITYWNNVLSRLPHLGIQPQLFLQTKHNFPEKLKKYVSVTDTMSSIEYCNIFHSTKYTFLQSAKSQQVVTVHDTIPNIFPQYFPEFKDKIQKCIDRASHIVAITENTKRDLLKYYKVNQEITVIYHGLDDCFHRSHLIDRTTIKANLKIYKIDKPLILFVGGRRLYKNFISLLKAYANLGISKDFDLVVVGSEKKFYPDEEFIISKFNLGEQVKLTGYVNLEELIYLYRTANAFIFSSLYEGFGLPLIEAMACGTPTACSDIAVFREIGGEIPVYFDPCNIEAIMTAIKSLLESDINSRIARGKEHSLDFKWSQSTEKLVKVYQKVIS